MPLSEITFLAPASGVVTEVLVSEGQYVSEGSPLYKLEGLNPLWVEAELYPREAAMVKQGDPVQIIVNGFGNEPVTGNVIFMNHEYRTGTQIITFRAALPNPDGNFITGTQPTLFLSNGTQTALTLPTNPLKRTE